MEGYIALLRGINVSGKNKILMADLKPLFQELGFKEVQTYIQSGNIAFKTKLKNQKKIAALITKMLKEKMDYTVPAIVKNKKEIEEIIAKNPFINEDVDTKKLTVTYLDSIPKEVQKLHDFNFGKDKYQIIKDVVYLQYETGAGSTKLTNSIIEKKLDVVATSRNWRTTCKLLEMF